MREDPVKEIKFVADQLAFYQSFTCKLASTPASNESPPSILPEGRSVSTLVTLETGEYRGHATSEHGGNTQAHFRV